VFCPNLVSTSSTSLIIAISIPNVHGKLVDNFVAPARGKRTRTRAAKLSISVSRYQGLLTQSRELIESICEQASHVCPSTLAQIVGLIMGETRLLSSLIIERETDQNLLAVKTIMLLGMLCSQTNLIPDRLKSVPYRREQATLEYENKQDYVSLKEIQWPGQQSQAEKPDEDLTDMLTHLSVTAKKRNTVLNPDAVLQAMPTGCTVVSVHLSESKEHFIISKLHPQGCVVVRLPLLKHPPEADEEPFTFESAYDELLEIITLNNQTAQAAKDVPDRKAKEEWWNTRKELDARLELFLQNMETCWIGGFTVRPS